MTNNDLEFIEHLFEAVNRAKGEFGNGFAFTLDYHSGKNYWTMQLSFERANARFSDCIVISPSDRNNVDPTGNEEILCRVDGIIEKATKLLK